FAISSTLEICQKAKPKFETSSVGVPTENNRAVKKMPHYNPLSRKNGLILSGKYIKVTKIFNELVRKPSKS
ncbi:MAG: hypothetical protein PHG61_12260, partial [Candidatus Marinimicrobia bacterium]|nr:hypothetical protein [Candidatus Neomarinimicrobiota bacterium]